MFRRLVMFLAVLVLIISTNASFAMSEEPNVGILRVDSFRVPREVAPNSVYSVMIDVLYNLHKRPNNATIRAAIYEGDVNFSNPLWQSEPVIVSNGGDEVWNVSLTSPTTEGSYTITAWAYFLDQGAWRFYNDSINGPSFSQATLRIAKTASLSVALGAGRVPVSIGNFTLTTSADGTARFTLFVGSSYVVSVAPTVEFQNSTRIIFSSWNDGDSQPQKSFVLDNDVSLVGSYKIQYLLKVNSPVSSHLEWFDPGSSANLQSPSSLPMNWPLGVLGFKSNFVGWTGDVNSPLPQLTLTMNGPKTVQANFSPDYGPLILLGILLAGVAGTIIVLFIRGHAVASEVENESIATAKPDTLRCGACGDPVESEWTHCNHCGAELENSKLI
jgi:hypothetical protein